MNGWPFLEWEEDPRRVEIITETLGLRRSGGTKTLSSLGFKRSMYHVNNVTGLSVDQARTYRSVCMELFGSGLARHLVKPRIMVGTCWTPSR